MDCINQYVIEVCIEHEQSKNVTMDLKTVAIFIFQLAGKVTELVKS